MLNLKLLSRRLERFVSPLELILLKIAEPSRHSLTLSIVTDLSRSKSKLIAENALLRQQLIILHRQVNQPRFTQSERFWLVLLASWVQHWKEVLLILKPDTLLRWHRLGFQLFWKFKSRNRGGRTKLAPDIISLIQTMAKENSLWGAERIHGELLKLNIEVATTTII